jgi:hypothetical protein
MLENFKSGLKKIFENVNHFKEEDVPKKEFIYTSPDGMVLKIEVEANEGEFYVYDKTGKQIDLFNMQLVNQDGAITKDVRQAIVDQFKGLNASVGAGVDAGDEVKVAEQVKPDVDPKKTAVTQRLTPTNVPNPQTAETQKIVKSLEEDKKTAETQIIKAANKEDPKTAETVKITKNGEGKKE